MEDIDGDSKTDLAVTNQLTDDIFIFKNTSSVGSASFTADVDYPLGASPRPLSIGDFDGDGKPDLAVGIGAVVILKNKLSENSCSSLKLTGRDTTCLNADTAIYYAARSANCNSAVQFHIDPAKASIVNSTDTSATIAFIRPGQVTLYASIAGPCKIVKDSVAINVFSSPASVNLGPDLQACPSFSYALHAGMGFRTYQWQDGSADSILVITSPGRYFVTTTNYCGGIFSDTVNVIAAPPVLVNIGNDTVKCTNDTLMLTATPGFNSYTWSPQYNISSTAGQTVKVFSKTDTTYKVVAAKNSGCMAMDSIKIKIYPLIPVNPGNDTSFCNGNSVILNAGPGFINYLWNTGATSQQINVAAAGEYIASVKDIHQCIFKDTFNIISVYQNPTIHLQKDTTFCQGSKLDAGTGFINYLWQDGSISQTYHVESIGKYWVTVTDDHQCRGSDTVDIKQILPAPSNFIVKDTGICEIQTILLKPSGQFSNYLWSTGEITNQINISSFGTYWLQVTNHSGCTAKEFINVAAKNCIRAVYFPNAFTPNKDGINEVFKADVFGTLKNFHLVVYDHFGQKLFETNDRTKGWDGQYKGKDMDSGTFVWYSEYQLDNEAIQNRKGIVTLIR